MFFWQVTDEQPSDDEDIEQKQETLSVRAKLCRRVVCPQGQDDDEHRVEHCTKETHRRTSPIRQARCESQRPENGNRLP